jgi:hypothetical protein
MIPFALLIKPVIIIGTLLTVKAGALTGFRFVENGLDWPATLEDLKQDRRFLSAVGTDTVKLLPAITRLQRAISLEDVIESAHDIKRAVDHLPDKTRAGLNNSMGLSRIIDSALQYGLARCGRAIIKQRADDEEVSIALARYYFGLFMIGRCNGQLNNQEQTDIILTLITLHNTRNSTQDMAISTILQTWWPEKAFDLGEALTQLREAAVLQGLAPSPMFKVYITRAIGGDVVPKNEPNLLEDLTEHFPDTSSTAA